MKPVLKGTTFVLAGLWLCWVGLLVISSPALPENTPEHAPENTLAHPTQTQPEVANDATDEVATQQGTEHVMQHVKLPPVPNQHIQEAPEPEQHTEFSPSVEPIPSTEITSRVEPPVQHNPQQLYTQITQGTPLSIQLHTPRSETGLIKHFYQCAGMQLGVLGPNNTLTRVYPRQQSNVPTSQWVRVVSGALDPRERNALSAANVKGTAVRLMPQRFDAKLMQHLANALNTHNIAELQSLSAQYSLSSNQVVLRNIVINNLAINQVWPLTTAQCA